MLIPGIDADVLGHDISEYNRNISAWPEPVKEVDPISGEFDTPQPIKEPPTVEPGKMQVVPGETPGGPIGGVHTIPTSSFLIGENGDVMEIDPTTGEIIGINGVPTGTHVPVSGTDPTRPGDPPMDPTTPEQPEQPEEVMEGPPEPHRSGTIAGWRGIVRGEDILDPGRSKRDRDDDVVDADELTDTPSFLQELVGLRYFGPMNSADESPERVEAWAAKHRDELSVQMDLAAYYHDRGVNEAIELAKNGFYAQAVERVIQGDEQFTERIHNLYAHRSEYRDGDSYKVMFMNQLADSVSGAFGQMYQQGQVAWAYVSKKMKLRGYSEGEARLRKRPAGAFYPESPRSAKRSRLESLPPVPEEAGPMEVDSGDYYDPEIQKMINEYAFEQRLRDRRWLRRHKSALIEAITSSLPQSSQSSVARSFRRFLSNRIRKIYGYTRLPSFHFRYGDPVLMAFLREYFGKNYKYIFG